jgi:type II secretory pathway component PulF
LPDALLLLAAEPGYENISFWAEAVARAWSEGRSLRVAGVQKELQLISDFLEAGREHARLADLLGLADDILRRRLQAQKALIQALAYPVALLCLGCAAFVILCGFVAPELIDLFGRDGAPFALQIMAGLGTLLRSIAPYIFVSLAVCLIGLLWASRSSIGGNVLVKASRRLPLFGKTLRRFDEVAYLQLWATYMAVGYGVDRALRSIGPLVPTALLPFHHRFIRKMRDGATLASALRDERGVSEAFKRAVRLGDANHQLEVSLLRGGEHLQQRAISELRRKLALIAPGMIVAIAAMTGWMMVSLMNALTALGGDL